MQTLIRLLPNLVKGGLSLWEKSKEWNAKKRIAMMIAVPVSLVAVSSAVYAFGWESVAFAAQILTELLAAFSEAM